MTDIEREWHVISTTHHYEPVPINSWLSRMVSIENGETVGIRVNWSHEAYEAVIALLLRACSESDRPLRGE